MPMPTAQLVGESPEPAGFEQQVAQTLLVLRRSVASVLAEVPGLDSSSSATHVQRALRINSKLSWQIHKFATTENPLEVACHLPKPTAMSRFCEAALKKSVKPALIEQLLRTFSEFDRLVSEHAGDRATFDAMVSNLAGDAGAAQMNLQHRRDAFRAQTHIWGVQATAIISLMIFRAGNMPGTVHGVTVGGQVNLRRFRHDARWILFTRTVASDKERIDASGAIPLNAEDAARYGAPLLAEFCSKPIGRFRTVETPQRVRCIEAESDGIGNTAAATYLSGEVWRNVAYTVEENGDKLLISRAGVRTPAQVLYHDIMVHRDLPLHPPEIVQYGELRTGDDAIVHHEWDRLPCYEGIAMLGRGVDAVYAPEFARYSEMAQYACNAVGWDPSEFEVVRCRIEYPVLPSKVVIRFRVRD